jgi:hypothetical protein
MGVIARPPWNEMDVTVHHSLTGNLSAVDSYVKAHHGRIRFANNRARFRNQPVTGS